MDNTPNKTAVRYLFYWTCGIAGSILLHLLFGNPLPGTWWVFGLVAGVATLSGIFYCRATDASERKRDAARKLTDPFYE